MYLVSGCFGCLHVSMFFIFLWFVRFYVYVLPIDPHFGHPTIHSPLIFLLNYTFGNSSPSNLVSLFSRQLDSSMQYPMIGYAGSLHERRISTSPQKSPTRDPLTQWMKETHKLRPEESPNPNLYRTSEKGRVHALQTLQIPIWVSIDAISPRWPIVL